MAFSIKIELHVHFHKDEKNKEMDRKVMEDKKQAEAFCRLVTDEIERQKLVMSQSTIENYLTALRSFQDYLLESSTDVCMDSGLFQHYEHWLHKRMVKPNTISCYMRSLRSLIAKIYGEEERRLFKNVYTGLAATDKRSISTDDINKLRSLQLKDGSFEAIARDLFLFSFYALGMPFVDMAFLRREQISNGQITYYRHKTGQPVNIKLEPCIQKIIDQYQDKNRAYVFPLLTSTEASTAYDEYLKALNYYNRTLKVLAVKSGISHRLTSYVPRHSWASIAYDKNVDLNVISKALGHANPQHTLIYIKQINDSRLDDANRKILECIGTNE